MHESASIVSPIRRIEAPVARRAGTALFVSAAATALRERLDLLAPTEATVLLIGETGTGKEVAARHLHAQSRRRSEPFVAVNCGALTDSLADAELFGYEKGAYTGAARTQVGWFEAAQGGTLLLDEIGELPLGLQVKLLRVLQEREITRVGSRHAIPINVRVIAATNVDLAAAVAAKRFREDLLFRLNVAAVRIPPLRERDADIEPLAQHFLHRYAGEHARGFMSFTDTALAALRHHRWPGNIRELDNVVQNAVLMAPGPRVEHAHLQLPSTPESAADAPEELTNTLTGLFRQYMQRGEPELFDRVTRILVQSAFSMTEGNQVRAARQLGITRNVLRTQLAHLGAIPPRQQASRERSRAAHGEQLRLGYQTYGTLSLLKADQALERRLADRGISVSWRWFAAGPQLLEALHGGEIDFGATGEVPPIFAQADGAPLTYVAHDPPAPKGVALVVPDESPVRDVGDLRGKRIAVSRGSNVHYLLVQILEAHGLALEDVQPVYLSPLDLARPFDGATADAWVAWDPFLTAAQRSGNLRVLLDGTGLVANHQFYVSRSEFAARHASVIEIVLEELRQITRAAVSNPSRAAHSVSRETGIDTSSLEIAIARLTHGARPLSLGVIREQQKIADRFYALGLIPRAIAVREAVWSPALV